MQIKYSKDRLCGFDPEWNSFFMGPVEKPTRRLRSWSKIIKQYTEQVDSKALADKYVRKHGGTVDAVLAAWEAKGAASRERGIKVHAIFDNYIQGIRHPHDAADRITQVADDFISDMFIAGRLKPLESEMVAYSEEHNCATLIDCIAEDKNGLRYIIDWKTDSVMKDNNYGRYMRPPFNMLPDHDLMKHKLQVNFCRALCTEYRIDAMYLGHIQESGYTLIRVDALDLNLAVFDEPKESLPF